MNNKRGYFGKSHKDADLGYAIVAHNTKEAKKLLWEKSNEFGEDEWNLIDLTIEWKRDANVENIPIGFIDDLRTGLKCGIFNFIEGGECDDCGGEGEYISWINGRAVCEECSEGFVI